jgi:hypothetical protein
MRTPRPLALLAALLVGALLVASCSSSSDDAGSAPTDDAEATTTSTAADAGEDDASSGARLERYAGYQSVSYDDPAHWICRPDTDDDLCDGDLDATVVDADGTLTVEPFEPAEDPAIDCFYVYPTISRDETAFSDWAWSEDEEGWTVLNQAARLQSQCRLYAPVYRQRTLAGLAGAIGGDGDAPADEGDPYADVLDAFKTYMATDNGGRGVVLIGHSQGSAMLNQLIQQEVDPNDDVRALLVGAYLAGSSVAVPEEGALVGGDFQNVPLCSADGEPGCVTTWATFRATAPPPAGSFFGAPRGGEGVAGCVNSADVDGAATDLEPITEELDAYFPTTGGSSILTGGGTDPEGRTWLDPSAGEVTTPWVRLPGLVSGACATTDGFSYLSVWVSPSPDGPRADDIPGDLSPEWGLHLVDVNLVMGDIVRQVEAQAAAHAASAGD